MEYLVILIILAAGIFFFLFRKREPAHVDEDKIEATYVCDKCGETYCDCHKVED